MRSDLLHTRVWIDEEAVIGGQLLRPMALELFLRRPQLLLVLPLIRARVLFM
jgi:hypothetical protein